MRRGLGILLTVGLVLAPAASAKGPHAVLSSGGERVEPGRPWHATVEFRELGQRVPHPVLIARNGDRRIAVRGSRGGAKYGFGVVFPAAGRWRLTLVDGNRRFAFPAVSVGAGDVPADYVAFPQGSMAERQGAGGVYYESAEPSGSGRDTPLPPQTVSLAGRSTGGGFPFWVLPAAGAVLAGAGIATVRARRQPPAGN
jgi:hypothetical protein